MSLQLRNRIFQQLDSIWLIDPHTHIDPHRPAAETLADILGYHYYTELAHSAGMSREEIEEPGVGPREKTRRLIANLGPVENTVQYSWLVEMAQSLLGFDGDRITPDNWEALYDTSERLMSSATWEQDVLRRSRLRRVFLTSDFDDPLEGFDTESVHPLSQDRRPGVRYRRTCRAGATGKSVGDLRPRPVSLAERPRLSIRALQVPQRPSGRDLAAARLHSGESLRARGGSRSGQHSAGRRRRRPPRAAIVVPFRFLDSGRVLRRVPAALRPDDRGQPGRLRGRGLPGAGPVRQPRLPDSVPRTVQRLPPGDVSPSRCWPASRIRS